MAQKINKLTIKKHSDNLQTLLESCRIKKDEDTPITHTMWSGMRGKFHIPEEKMEQFHKLYAIEVYDGKKLGIIEQHTEVSPLLIDFDFKFDENVTERQFNEKHIKNIVQFYIDEIEESFIINNRNDDLIAFVFQRDEPYEYNGNIKDGIHIIFPYIISEPHIQYIIRDNVIKRCIEEKILDDIPTKNQMNDIIDRSVIYKNGWFMFGSSKPYCDPYKLTTIYDCNLDSIPMDEVDYHGISDLPRFFSIRRHSIEDATMIKQSKYEEIEKVTKRQTSLTLKHMKQYQNTQYDVQQISNLLNILSNERANDYNMWMEIGWCLYNINQNDIELLNLWAEFSKKNPKFKDGECEKLWSKMRGMNNNGKKLGIGSLYYWAKHDNYDEYMAVKRKDIRYYIDKSMNCTNYDIARVMFEMFKYQHVCASIKYNSWYEFRDHRWHEDDGAISLRQKISTNLVNEYFRIISDYNVEWAKIDMDTDLTSEEKDKRKQEFEEKTKVLSNIMIKLKTTAFKDNIMRECRELFHEKGFINKLDENQYLIGFENGVYDLQKLEFRDGEPEDYVSMSTGNYYIEYDENNPQVDDVNDFLNKILPKFNVKEYAMKLLASTLQGHNAEEKFRIWTGCHAKGTKIMMYDGTCKNVEDVNVGEQLMGDDSQPRNVLQLAGGYSDMYKVIPIKGDPYVVNGDHILCLKATKIGSLSFREKLNIYDVHWHERDENGYPVHKAKNFPYKYEGKQIYRKGVTYYEDKDEAYQAALEFYENIQQTEEFIKQGDVIEIPVRVYLERLSKIGKGNYFGYRVAVDYPEKEIELDPYLLGYWIGDGHSAGTAITTMEDEVVDYYQQKVDEMGLVMRKGESRGKAATYYIKGGENKNSFLKALQDYGLINDKHIPYVYKCNSRDIRLKVLAGIIDSDGHYQKSMKQYEITMKSEKVIDDIVDLCRSLGYACYKKKCKKTCTNGKNGPVEGTYYRIQIFGNGLEEIPVLLERKKGEKRTMNKNPLLYGIKIEKVNDDNYYGFHLDGNHRYLLQDFTVTHNTGGNGKTKLLELHAMALGEYADSFDVMLFTGKRAQSNAATPEVALSKGKRFMQVDEPEEGAKINVGLMKYYTGGDKIKARGLFKDPVEFKPQFKIVLVCNELPEVPPHDGGVWRRLEIVEFTSKFVDNPVLENEFKKDPELSNKLKAWGETFMSMLIYYYKIYKQEGVVPPKEVTKYTDEFQKDCDTYSDFITERLIRVSNNNFTTTISEVCREFKMWHTESNISSRLLSRKQLVQYLIKKFGKTIISNEYIKGFGLKSKEAEIRADEINRLDNEHFDDSDLESESNNSVLEVDLDTNGQQIENHSDF